MKSPVWIEKRDVLTIHERLLALHGGISGLRDEGLLESALARPRQHLAYDKSADVPALAAYYASGIVQNHPFVDGNKRTGFVIGVLFLELNGFRFTAMEEEVVEAVFALAAGALKEDGFAEFMRSNSTHRKRRSQ